MPPANEAERWKWENAAAGAVAGFATVAALHPLDVVRTRFQEASVTLPRPHSLFLVTSDEEKPVAKKSLPREVLLIHNAVMRFFGRKRGRVCILYCLVRVVHTGPIGYRYADRLLLGGTIESGVSPRRNEETPRLPAQDEAMPPSLRRNKVMPRLPAQDEAMPPSLRRNKVTPRLPAWENEASPHYLVALFSRDARQRCF
ncbi:hypothetical protein BHM03_00039793, partial [Ensete ventricosum]